MVTNTAASIFWTAYGFSIMDYFQIFPNGIGALLGFVQIFLMLIFPRKEEEEQSMRGPKDAEDDKYELEMGGSGRSNGLIKDEMSDFDDDKWEINMRNAFMK
eukprot:CAMPEP_0172520062 /NCGR_PEP_ID=MMETSP1066-20121228/291782_1 /TAXON_ID=671091 /ORGANISM="Coscinodiscus wailesii, Strain CCMP2513" /LENGTH=101 /DNA_ID=CAMNT_0013302753 /DNA_START=1106 /DNA_END=1411 /DNA_ORIENTATION=-